MAFDSTNDICIICLDRVVDRTITDCKHLFHYECISNWINRKNSCPMCRKSNPQIKKEEWWHKVYEEDMKYLSNVFKQERKKREEIEIKKQEFIKKNKESIWYKLYQNDLKYVDTLLITLKEKKVKEESIKIKTINFKKK